MTILSFCALFPLLHVVSLQPSQLSYTFLLSFSMCSSFPCCGGIVYTFRPGYATDLCIYVENLEKTEANSHFRFSPLIFFFFFTLSGTHTQSCLGFFILLLQLKGSLSNYFCSVLEDSTELFRLFHPLSSTKRISVKLLCSAFEDTQPFW